MRSGGAAIGRRALLASGLACLVPGAQAGTAPAAAQQALPAAVRQQLVPDMPTLERALREARPGDHLVLAPGHWALGTIAVSGTETAPIVIRALEPRRATLADDPVISGDHIRLHGLAFGPHSLGRIEGADCWIVGCSFLGPAADSIRIRPRAPGCRVWFCEMTGQGRMIAFDTGGRGIQGHVKGCWFHDVAPGGDNATEVITVGFSANRTAVVSDTLIEDCLFEDCNLDGQEDETIAIKSSHVTVRRCTFRRTRYLQVRHGTHNRIEEVTVLDSPTGGISIFDADNHVINCRVGNGVMHVRAGDRLTAAAGGDWPASAPGFPAAFQTHVYNGEFDDFRIGSFFRSGAATHCAHGTVVLGNRGGPPHYGHGSGACDTATNDPSLHAAPAPVPYRAPALLTTAEVGPRAAR